MEQLEHELWIVQGVNAAFGPLVAAMLRMMGRAVPAGHVIPDYLAMAAVVVAFWTIVCLIVRRGLSVENPGTLQVLIEDAVAAAQGMLHDYVGHKGPRYLAIVTTMFVFILTGNLMGLFLVFGLVAGGRNVYSTVFRAMRNASSADQGRGPG